MVDEIDDELTTEGDSGSSTTNSSTKSRKDTSRIEGAAFNMTALLDALDSRLDEKLSALRPAEQHVEKPNESGRVADVKLYTEEDVVRRTNAAVRSRLTEKEEQFKTRLEDLKTQWRAEVETEYSTKMKQAVDEAVAARDFDLAKQALKTELNLSDAQVSRLQGKNVDELRVDAQLLGFVKTAPTEEVTKKTPPAISTGGNNNSSALGMVDDSIAAQVREGLGLQTSL